MENLGETVEKIEKSTNRWYLDSDQYLVKEKVTKEIEVTQISTISRKGNDKVEKSEKDLNSNVKTLRKIPLRRVTDEEIMELRKSKLPGFILKKGEDLFYAPITEDMTTCLYHLFEEKHKCAENCEHMSAASDENGGCAKVRNKATFIEMYPWISLGFETFNTIQDTMYIARCSNYEVCKPRSTTIPIEERAKFRQSLVEYLYN